MIQRKNAEEVEKLIRKNGNIRLIDVREEWEYNTARINNSELMPLSNFMAHSHKLKKEDELVFYCHYGYRSLQVCNYLDKLGYENLINLEGGIDAWAKNVDDSIPLY